MKAFAKVHNAESGWKAKVEIRQRVLEQLGPAQCRVFDAFAGAGLMWSAVWRQAATYVGCDERWHQDDRCCFAADNRRVLRCLDLSAFNCFDFDAFGSPWEQAIILAVRRPPLRRGERLGLVLTEGTSLKTALSSERAGLPAALRQAAGLTRTADVGGGRLHDELIARALAGVVRRMNGQVVKQWRAIGTTGAKMRYVGVVVEGMTNKK